MAMKLQSLDVAPGLAPHPAPPAPIARWRASQATLTAVVIAVFTLAMMLKFAARPSADMLGVWMAGKAMAAHLPGAVYPADGQVFTLLPPQAWAAWMRAEGRSGAVYPFIYPPLWAWAMGKLTAVMTFGGLDRVLSVAFPVMQGLCLVIAHRLAAPRMHQTLFVGIGLLVLSLSYIGSLALYQSQPQVIVALLTLAAIERAEAGRPRLAGCLLAVAAAMKIYPAIYALFWLAQGNRRASGSFALAGAALAALSVAVAGWPLHQEFLRMLGVVSHTALMMPFNYTLAAAVAQFTEIDAITWVRTLSDPASDGYLVIPMAFWLTTAMKATLALAVTGAALLLARARTRAERAAVWPMALIVVALASPLSWSYHYIAAAAFLPMLLDRLKPGLAMALILAITVLLGPFLPVYGIAPHWMAEARQIAGTLTLIGVAGLFWAIRHLPENA